MKTIEYDKDYAGTWINLQAEVKMLHHYCLKGDWETARQCAINCSQYSSQLAKVLDDMAKID